jgi:DNA primase
MKLTNDSAIADIAVRYNELRTELGLDTSEAKALAKRGKAKLLDAIDSMEDTLATKRAAEAKLKAIADGAKVGKSEPKPTKVKKEKAPKKEKGPVIRVEAEKLLLEVISKDEDGRPYGLSYESILGQLRVQFDGAKTTVACLRWYAVHMRERGERVPNRPRAGTQKPEVSAL